MPSSIILGIDPGTAITGYGLIAFESSKYVALDYGCIRPPLTLKLTDRYLIIHEGVEELIERFSPSALVVETQYVAKNPQSALKLGMARGAIMMAGKRKKVPIFAYSPTEAKRAVVGTGKASKQQVQKMVQQILHLPLPPQPEDAADALALAICHWHMAEHLKKEI